MQASRDYVAHREFYKAHPPSLSPLYRFRDFLQVSIELTSLLQKAIAAAGSQFTGWTADDRRRLVKELEHLNKAATEYSAKTKRRRGRPTDRNRKSLEKKIAQILIAAGIRPTRSRDGTLARVFEKVHAVIGLKEREAHKAARVACDALGLVPARSAVITSKKS